MKKKQISIIALLAIVFLLSSCDVTTLLDTFKGNAYEDVFNIDLVGEQAQEAVEAVAEASEPVEVDQSTFETDNPDIDINADGIEVIDGQVPLLPEQNDEEKEELKSTVAQSLSGSSTDDFLEGLEEEADEEQAAAANNSAVVVNNLLDEISDPANLDGLDPEVQGQIADLANDLQLDLPEDPTQADILNVQLASNLVNSLSDVLGQIDGGADLDDEDVVDGLLEVVSDAAFMLKVAKAQGSTSDLINSLDINNLLDLFMDDSGSSSDTPEDESSTLDQETVTYLNAFRSTVDLVLRDILGVDETTLAMDQDKFDEAIRISQIQKSAIETFLVTARAGNFDYDSFDDDDRSEFTGVNGVITYTIATVLVNVDPVFNELSDGMPEDYNSIKEIVDALLSHNEDLVYVDEYDTDMEFVLPGEVVKLGDGFSDDSDILENLQLVTTAKTYLDNSIYLVELGLENPEGNFLYDALVDARSSLDQQ